LSRGRGFSVVFVMRGPSGKAMKFHAKLMPLPRY
jgi:hypothetical protein